MTGSELQHLVYALHEIAVNHDKWMKDYRYDKHSNEFHFDKETFTGTEPSAWFDLPGTQDW
jgi:hypothetical protein